MPRKGENIYKRKDGRWEGRFIKGRSSDGRALYGYVYAPTYKEVRTKLATCKKEVKNKTASNTTLNNQPHNSIQFTSMSEVWLGYIKPRIKESSYIKHRNIVHSYLIPHLGETNVSDISNDRIDCLCQELLKRGGKNNKGLSSKTVTDILSVVRSILYFAEKQYNIKTSDCRGISIKKHAKELCVLSRNNQTTLLNYATQNMNDRNLGIIICLCTGLRLGEVCALRWEDISFREKTIYVHQTMQRIQVDEYDTDKKTKITVTPPKSPCSIRHIPMSDFLVEILQNPTFSHHGFLLTGDNNKYVEPRAMEYHFKKILEQCEINIVNFHALRHTFATRCIEVGFDVKSLSEILGHASVAITMNRYVHPSMELKRENMEKLSDVFAVK